VTFNRRRLDAPRDVIGESRATKEYFERLHDDMIALVPVGGQVGWSASLAVPDGWLRADGSTVSRTDYKRLFAIYGTTFGAGDGSTTFTLPTNSGFILKY
jgi:hypothetical protein